MVLFPIITCFPFVRLLYSFKQYQFTKEISFTLFITLSKTTHQHNQQVSFPITTRLTNFESYHVAEICLYHFGRKSAQKQMYVTCCERIEKVSCYKEVIKLIKTSYWKIIVFGKVCLVKMVQHLIWRLSLILMISMKQSLVNDK